LIWRKGCTKFRATFRARDRTRERFMGIGQVLTMPIFFASNAIYPIDIMPSWLRTIWAASRSNELDRRGILVTAQSPQNILQSAGRTPSSDDAEPEKPRE